MHHLVSNSPWDEPGVLDDIAATVSTRIGDALEGSLHIDESGFEKQGVHSVGVARQYRGRQGKVDNCQVGVFLGYTHNGYRLLLNRKLYLPEVKDKQRRKRCGVPKEVEFQTKAWDFR